MLPEYHDVLACPTKRLSNNFAHPQDMTSQSQPIHSGGELKPCKRIVTPQILTTLTVTGAGMFRMKVRHARIQHPPFV